MSAAVLGVAVASGHCVSPAVGSGCGDPLPPPAAIPSGHPSPALLHAPASRHISPHLATSRHISGRLLQLAAQPADVAAASAAYARVQLPGVPLFWAANALQATLTLTLTLT